MLEDEDPLLVTLHKAVKLLPADALPIGDRTGATGGAGVSVAAELLGVGASVGLGAD